MMDLWTLPMWLRLVWCTPFVRACDILCARVLHTATFAVTEPTVSAAAGKRLDSFAMRWLNMRLACFGHLWVDNNAANGAVL